MADHQRHSSEAKAIPCLSTYRTSSVTMPTTTIVFFSFLGPFGAIATETMREREIGGPATYCVS